MIDDRQAPDNIPKITITTAEPLHGIYNKDVDFEIQVIDPKVNGTYSGLKEVSYEILKDGEVTQSGNYNNELLDATQRMQSITRNETVEAEINNSNNIQIKVTAVDQSGNKATETKNISIDITAPTIDVTYDLNSPLNDVSGEIQHHKHRRNTAVYQRMEPQLQLRCIGQCDTYMHRDICGGWRLHIYAEHDGPCGK